MPTQDKTPLQRSLEAALHYCKECSLRTLTEVFTLMLENAGVEPAPEAKCAGDVVERDRARSRRAFLESSTAGASKCVEDTAQASKSAAEALEPQYFRARLLNKLGLARGAGNDQILEAIAEIKRVTYSRDEILEAIAEIKRVTYSRDDAIIEILPGGDKLPLPAREVVPIEQIVNLLEILHDRAKWRHRAPVSGGTTPSPAGQDEEDEE